jgi:transcriptional regulator with XRE-family HTH domain
MAKRMTFADKLRRARGTRSYAEIGRQLGCAPETVRKWEAGQTSPLFEAGNKLARLLGVPADWLADDAQDWPPPVSQREQAVELVERALSSAGLAGQLSPQERELLASIRKLGPQGLAQVAGFVRGLETASAAAADPTRGADLAAEVDGYLARRSEKKRSG